MVYAYDDNSNVTRIDYPAGASSGAVFVYGYISNKSDDDRVYQVKRDTTTLIPGAHYRSFGPVFNYSTANGIVQSSTLYKFVHVFLHSQNYLTNQQWVYAAGTSPTQWAFKINYSQDVRQRFTRRDFTYGTGAQRDMFFLYDDLNRVTCRRTTSGSTCPTSGSTLGENISYNSSGDRSSVILRNGVYTDTTFTPAYVSATSDELDKYSYGGGNNKIDYAHDTLGRRTSDDDTNFGGTPDKDARTFTYDGRNNLVTVSGEYWTGSTWHTYTVSYAYDEKNRLIFKSFVDEDANCAFEICEAQWFFYWDQFDRLIQAKHTPDITDSNTYSIFQWYWLNDRPVAYYQIDYPNATTTRRFLESDEQNRPLAAWDWPTSGSATRVWEVDPGLFGWDEVTVGADIYQPIRFPGQLYDEDTEAWADDSGATLKRPGICYNRFRSYDSFTGGYLQSDPLVGQTWDAYGYVQSNPVMSTDPTGLFVHGFLKDLLTGTLGWLDRGLCLWDSDWNPICAAWRAASGFGLLGIALFHCQIDCIADTLHGNEGLRFLLCFWENPLSSCSDPAAFGFELNACYADLEGRSEVDTAGEIFFVLGCVSQNCPTLCGNPGSGGGFGTPDPCAPRGKPDLPGWEPPSECWEGLGLP